MAVNVLLSFAFFGKDDLGAYRANMPCGRIMIDSGAFTVFTKGHTIDVVEYAEFLENWRHVWDYAITLDVIGDPKATARNTKVLHDRGLPVMPVFTRGGTVLEFDAMVRDTGYVCVGGGVGMPNELVIRRLSALQHRAQEQGGGIHALGVGNLDGLRAIRPYSCDASNVSSAFRFGTLICYDGRRLWVFPHTQHRSVRKHLLEFKDQGLTLSEMIGTGRQPSGAGRAHLMRHLSVAYLCADEDTTAYGVPVPTGVDDTPGVHMYSAVTAPNLMKPVAELDRLAHTDEWTVPMWTRYRAKHAAQCRARVPQEVS